MAQLPALPNLPSTDALLLRPGDAQFADYQKSFNTRTALTPQLRALCKTAGAVGVLVDWCRSNNLPFALRSGGHSYEGIFAKFERGHRHAPLKRNRGRQGDKDRDGWRRRLARPGLQSHCGPRPGVSRRQLPHGRRLRPRSRRRLRLSRPALRPCLRQRAVRRSGRSARTANPCRRPAERRPVLGLPRRWRRQLWRRDRLSVTPVRAGKRVHLQYQVSAAFASARGRDHERVAGLGPTGAASDRTPIW